jgi:predicted GIY-YIG superfamily endonuclease
MAKARSRWYVYVVRCADGTLYTGTTTDTARRVAQHNAGTASRYTRSRLPVVLVYQKRVADQSAALVREAAIKKLSRGEKEVLIAARPPVKRARADRVKASPPAAGRGARRR